MERQDFARGPSRDEQRALDTLKERAVRDYGTRCFWNCPVPDASPRTMRVVALKLRENGDMKAWTLANRIDDILDDLRTADAPG